MTTDVKLFSVTFYSQAELDCLMSIDDPNIVRLYQVYTLDDFIYMVMEYCPYDLGNVLDKIEKLSDNEMKRLTYDIISALKSIHDRDIAHCDIKPANFFIDKYGRVKIGDFGLASINGNTCLCKMKKGTRLYMAPELYVLKQYNAMKSDIWSLGVTLYYLATKTHPFNAPDVEKLQQCVNIGLFAKEKITNKLLLDIISKCLVKNPNKRPSTDELLKSPYFTTKNNEIPNNHVCCFSKCLRAVKQIVRPQIKMQKSFGILPSPCRKMNRIKLSTSLDALAEASLPDSNLCEINCC